MVASNETQVKAALDSSDDRVRRRIDRVRRSGLFDHIDVTIEQAKTTQELAQAYRLVHDVYVQRNYIVNQPHGLRLREFEALPDMATFVAKVAGRVVAVMSIVPDDPTFGLPSDKAFQAELDDLRNQGRHICEVTNLAIDPSYRNGALFLELTRVIMAHAMVMGYDDGFVSISEEHGPFFQTILLFDPCGERRNYGGDTVDYVIGMRFNCRTFEQRITNVDQGLGSDAFLHDFFFTNNYYFNVIKQWHQEAKMDFLKPSSLENLFIKESSFLCRCDDFVIEGLRKSWGSAVFDQIQSLDHPAEAQPVGAAVEKLAA